MSPVRPVDATYMQEMLGRLPGSGEPPTGFDGGGGGGDDGDMKERVEKLEAAIQTIQLDLAVIKSNYTTKADLADVKGTLEAKIAEAKNSVIMWVVATVLLAQVLPAVLKRFGM